MQEEGHVPLFQQVHTRPLYVEHLWTLFELGLQEELRVEGVGSYLDQLFPLFFLRIAVIYLLAIKSDEVQAPPPLTSILIHLLMVKEDEVLQEDDFGVKDRAFPQI